MGFSIIAHGGAWDIPKEYHEDHKRGIEKALKKGIDSLKSGMTAIDACVEVVKELENDPTFDAGTGAFLNEAGEVELDALIMNGADLSIGSVIAVKDVKNPIELANLIRLNTEHCVLAAEGASRFAQKMNIPLVQPEELLVGRELERYQELLKSGEIKARSFFDKPSKMGTVGCVIKDSEGNIACATSTGGTPNKMVGRIGDSPLPGSGGYANKIAGASTTGWGESIMKVLLAKTAVDGVEYDLNPTVACQKAIHKLQEEASGLGGVILIDKEGKPGFAYNTPYMACGYGDENGIQYVQV